MYAHKHAHLAHTSTRCMAAGDFAKFCAAAKEQCASCENAPAASGGAAGGGAGGGK
jgi:hypothetical protein